MDPFCPILDKPEPKIFPKIWFCFWHLCYPIPTITLETHYINYEKNCEQWSWHIARWKNSQTGKQTDRLTDKQTDKTDRTHGNRHIHFNLSPSKKNCLKQKTAKATYNNCRNTPSFKSFAKDIKSFSKSLFLLTQRGMDIIDFLSSRKSAWLNIA